MNIRNTNIALQHIQSFLFEYSEYMIERQMFPNKENTAKTEKLQTMAQEISFRFDGSIYPKRAKLIFEEGGHRDYVLDRLAGLVKALNASIKTGFLNSLTELIHAEVFTDFLEMAEHLLGEGYKDPAAVIAGSTLETHIKKLAVKYDVNLFITDKNGKTHPKKAAVINNDLNQKGAYTKLEHKQIAAWQQLRNDAAHGDFDQFTPKQVEIMIMGIRNFIVSYPA